MNGGAPATSRVCWKWSDPRVLTTMNELRQLLRNDDYAFVMFHMIGCGHCEAYAPTHRALAHLMHETFRNTGGQCLPVVVGLMEGTRFADEINEYLAQHHGATEPVINGFPTLLLKRPDGAISVYGGDRKVTPILAYMREFFGDESLQPSPCDLSDVLPNGMGAEYTILYSADSAEVARLAHLAPTSNAAQAGFGTGLVCRAVRSGGAGTRVGGGAVRIGDPARPPPPQVQLLLARRPNLQLPAVLLADGSVIQGDAAVDFLARRA